MIVDVESKAARTKMHPPSFIVVAFMVQVPMK